jgi:nucleotide-binding universal stress UspA family protein
MKTFAIKRILVPVDFSETGIWAVDYAAAMAKLFSAQLYLLQVVKSIEYAYNEVKEVNEGEDHRVASEKIDTMVEGLRSRFAIDVSPLINVGKLAQSIGETCKNENIDLVIMSNQGAHGLQEYVAGSNADRVINAAPCPVITIQSPVKKAGLANIVMPIDNSLHSREKVDTVIEIAKHYNSKIHLIGLLDNKEELDEKKFNIKMDSVENAIKKTQLPYIRKQINCHDIALEAIKYSYQVRADLLVIMNDSEESRYSGLFLGYLTKHVINHSTVPVMTIKPNEYYVIRGLYSSN